MLHQIYLMPLFPLVGFVLLVAFGKRMNERTAGIIGTTAVAAAFVVAAASFVALLGTANREVTQSLFTWIPVGSLQVKVSFLLDPLSVTMVLFVTFISALIHLYSMG